MHSCAVGVESLCRANSPTNQLDQRQTLIVPSSSATKWVFSTLPSLMLPAHGRLGLYGDGDSVVADTESISIPFINCVDQMCCFCLHKIHKSNALASRLIWRLHQRLCSTEDPPELRRCPRGFEDQQSFPQARHARTRKGHASKAEHGTLRVSSIYVNPKLILMPSCKLQRTVEKSARAKLSNPT